MLYPLNHLSPQKAAGSNPRAAGRRGGGQQFAIVRLVTTTCLLERYVVFFHSTFHGHGC